MFEYGFRQIGYIGIGWDGDYQVIRVRVYPGEAPI
jgi:hypothetical protein